jgi:uncharacterized protein YndB with AHSA1/START domain
MTPNTGPGRRVLGSVRTAEGEGIVRIEDSFDTDRDDLWSALTDPRRLTSWYGQVEGDLRAGGEFRARVLVSGWEGTGRVDVCEPPRHLVVTSREADAPDDEVVEATLSADGDRTVLVLEQRGLPVHQLAAYAAGLQVHVEDLAAHIAGRERVPGTRWGELLPAYQKLAAEIG